MADHRPPYRVVAHDHRCVSHPSNGDCVLKLGKVAGAMMIWIEATAQQDALLNDPRITPWLDTLTACTLVVNVLVTCAPHTALRFEFVR